MSRMTVCEPQQYGNSGFLDLPSEIRIQIYRYLFKDTSVRNYADWDEDWKPRLSAVVSILLTSKLCYGEARSTFYSQTTLHLKDSVTLNDDTPSYNELRMMLGQNAQQVRYIHYHGEDPKFVFQIQETFPSLKEFDMHLGEVFCHSDQLNFDRALRYILRYGDWKTAVKDALDERYGTGMRDAFARLRHLGSRRGFRVTMHWFKAYRFIDFVSRLLSSLMHKLTWDREGMLTLTNGFCGYGIQHTNREKYMRYVKTHWSQPGVKAG